MRRTPTRNLPPLQLYPPLPPGRVHTRVKLKEAYFRMRNDPDDHRSWVEQWVAASQEVYRNMTDEELLEKQGPTEFASLPPRE
jgi:hypothetical protein